MTAPKILPALVRDAFPNAPAPSTILLLAPQTAAFFHFHPAPRPPVVRPLSPHSRLLPALARRCDAILNQTPSAPPLLPSAHRVGQLVLDLDPTSTTLSPFLVAAANAGARIADASPTSPLRAPSPSDEIIDVVTPRGAPTGQTVPRALAHRTGLRHRTTHLWLYRRAPDGALEVLLQFRSPQKDSYPSCYDISAAGHVPAGADWIPSALRELGEELGVAASPSDLLPLGRRAIHTRTAFRGVPHDNLQVSAVYALHCPRPLSDFTPQPSEVAHLRWMPLSEVFASLSSPAFPNCLSPDELRRLLPL